MIVDTNGQANDANIVVWKIR